MTINAQTPDQSFREIITDLGITNDDLDSWSSYQAAGADGLADGFEAMDAAFVHLNGPTAAAGLAA